jgi:hypothetical protein
MIAGLRGSLLSHDALARRLREAGGDRTAAPAMRSLAAWRRAVRDEAGPAWPMRLVFDRIATPVCEMLGFSVVPAGGSGRAIRGVLERNARPAIAMVALGWGQDDGTAWREAVRAGIEAGARWAFAFTGPALRIYDTQRTHSRRFAEFDLDTLAHDPTTFALARIVLGDAASLDAAVVQSERHRAEVRASLQTGVHDALIHLTRAFAASSPRIARAAPAGLLDESLVVVYRVLFLLFAEARGLVPAWHPVFRDSYTIEALREPLERHPRPRGLWPAIQALSRLAHRGCRAGTLRVPPFNGRLFSPVGAPLADTVPLDDGSVREALLALTTRPTGSGRERIAYGDLGVEQLGGVYERVLDYDLAATGGGPALVRGGRRKASGTFYTPRALTDHVVRRTLAPLVRGATPEQILALRVLDPAMGSGAFLVAACRYLARAYEHALVDAGGISAGDLTEAERAGFRRLVAQRCLYGVDINPMAVQLARLSLWLSTFAGDRPLTFFDHHLRAGNSLVGTTLDVVRRGRPGVRRRAGPLPLFDEAGLDAALGSAVASFERLRDHPEDTLAQVRAKERLFDAVTSSAAPVGRWKGISDLWCAGWFDPGLRNAGRGVFDALLEAGPSRTLTPAVERTLLERAQAAAARQRFFHWELEFPDVFHSASGAARDRPGFDALIGNPPWEMMRGDTGDTDARRHAADAGAALTRFARDSGLYRLQGGGHANLYQLFVERSLALVRGGGRLGLVLPSGLTTDHGCSVLRRHLFTATAVDSCTIVENHERLFPIHRSLKFLALTLTKSPPAPGAERSLPLRAGVRTVQALDQLPDIGTDPAAVRVPVRLLERMSGDQLAVPELRTTVDLRIAAAIAFGLPASGDADGWGLRFGRELNATDDRTHFNTAGDGLPIVEGKHVGPFAVDTRAPRQHIRPSVAERVLGRRPFDRARLAYRDVASATNRLTLIAAVLPPETVTTHTLFCLRTPLDEQAQHFLCGLFNSFVANYLVRLRVTTHVTVAIVERLPLPKPPRASRAFRLIAANAALLAAGRGGFEEHVALQAAAARLYGLERDGFAHVLSTFPLVDSALRSAVLTRFT